MTSPRQIATEILLHECEKNLAALIRTNSSSAADYNVPDSAASEGWDAESVRQYSFRSYLEKVDLLLKAVSYNFE